VFQIIYSFAKKIIVIDTGLLNTT